MCRWNKRQKHISLVSLLPRSFPCPFQNRHIDRLTFCLDFQPQVTPWLVTPRPYVQYATTAIDLDFFRFFLIGQICLDRFICPIENDYFLTFRMSLADYLDNHHLVFTCGTFTEGANLNAHKASPLTRHCSANSPAGVAAELGFSTDTSLLHFGEFAMFGYAGTLTSRAPRPKAAIREGKANKSGGKHITPPCLVR